EPRRPDCSQDVLPNLPSSSPGCSGAICRSACYSASPSDPTPAKSRDVPATPQPPSCNFIRYRVTRRDEPIFYLSFLSDCNFAAVRSHPVVDGSSAQLIEPGFVRQKERTERMRPQGRKSC